MSVFIGELPLTSVHLENEDNIIKTEVQLNTSNERAQRYSHSYTHSVFTQEFTRM